MILRTCDTYNLDELLVSVTFLIIALMLVHVGQTTCVDNKIIEYLNCLHA